MGTHITFQTAASGTADNNISFAEKLRIQNTGGISFNGDTGANNALADYEHGTFTPAFKAANNAASATTTVNESDYVKIGDLVYFTCYLTLTAHAAGTTGGNGKISGLPYTCQSKHCSVSVGFFNAWAADQMFISGTVQPGENQVLIRHTTAVSQSITNLDYDNNWAPNSQIIVSGCYVAT